MIMSSLSGFSIYFLRMDMATFNGLLEMVTSIIKRRDTLMRDLISM
jgi:hypothetical protein